MKKTLLVCSAFLMGFCALAQENIYTLPLKSSGKKVRIALEEQRQLTSRASKDSEPLFINKTQIVFSAEDESGQADLILYSLDKNKFTNISMTKDRQEALPKMTDCGFYVSSLTQDEEGLQRLYLYPTNLAEPELLYDDLHPLLDYCWYDNHAVLSLGGEQPRTLYARSRENPILLATKALSHLAYRPKSTHISYLEGDQLFVLEIVENAIPALYTRMPEGTTAYRWLSPKLLLAANAEGSTTAMKRMPTGRYSAGRCLRRLGNYRISCTGKSRPFSIQWKGVRGM
ncbi:hypothetical protein [Nitritalea halalkaliphila]|nr:hypothetical protein [Nitritalea halalkaliphila]